MDSAERREYDRKRAADPERRERRRVQAAEWRKRNPDKVKAHNQQRAADPDAKARDKAQREQPEIRARRLAYSKERAANRTPEQKAAHAAAQTARYRSDPEYRARMAAARDTPEAKARQAATDRRRKEDPEIRARQAEVLKRWQRANRDRCIEYAQKREAMKLAQFVEDVERAVVWERDQGVCKICGDPADINAWDLDHIIPLSLGGLHSYANTAVSHPTCNNRKYHFDPRVDPRYAHMINP